MKSTCCKQYQLQNPRSHSRIVLKLLEDVTACYKKKSEKNKKAEQDINGLVSPSFMLLLYLQIRTAFTSFCLGSHEISKQHYSAVPVTYVHIFGVFVVTIKDVCEGTGGWRHLHITVGSLFLLLLHQWLFVCVTCSETLSTNQSINQSTKSPVSQPINDQYCLWTFCPLLKLWGSPRVWLDFTWAAVFQCSVRDYMYVLHPSPFSGCNIPDYMCCIPRHSGCNIPDYMYALHP